ncbi:hypothetical protein DRP53_01400 [candidate division WOR-3 bacterium]|uniref:YfhO family protein n=1 Tax=candidate division WOR-3 bacterium TaxID=2052148 RepID=A0A660SN42_UNCW3|nr:MAG: hypothetical protein DRP53_01400 [candidate division WOR-3 bacterium]
MSESNHRIALFLVLLGILILIFLPTLFSNRMIFGTDFLTGGYPRRYLEFKEHKLLFWLPHTFGGVPGIGAATFGDAFYPVSIILRFLRVLPHQIQVYLYLIHLLLAGIFTYLFAFDLTRRREAAMVAAVAYMFTGPIFSLIYAGHEGRMIVNCLLPVVFFLLNRGLDQNRLYYFGLAGFVYGCSILSPHVQMAYYLGMMATVFFIIKLIGRKGKVLKLPIIGYIGFVIIGALIAAPLALPLLKYIPFSPRGGAGRGYAWATSWSMPPEETLNLLTPHFSGLLDNYWGCNFFKLHTEYLGILPLLLALIGVIYSWREKETRFFTAWSIFALIFTWGGHTPIYRIFYHLLWGVNKFRAPAQIFYTFAFSIAVLAAIGTDRLLKGVKDEKTIKKISLGFATPFLLLLILVLMRGPIVGVAKFLSPNRVDLFMKNLPQLETGAFLSLLFAILSISLIFLLNRKRIKPIIFGIIASIFIFLDLWIIDHQFLKTVDPPARYYAPDEIVGFLKKDRSRFRVFPIEYRSGNYLLIHDIENCGGEHGNQLKRYQDFIGAKNTVMFRPTHLHNQNMLSILNVKYLIIPNHDPSRLPSYHPNPYLNSLLKVLRDVHDTTRYRKVYQGYRFAIYENLRVIPRAVIYYDYAVLPEDAIIPTIMSPQFDPNRIICLEEDIGLHRQNRPYTPVRITSYHPNRIELTYESETDGILYLADNYYPMWHAAVDGKEVEVYRANYTFRAIKAPKGTHRVSFWFNSPYINLGIGLMIAGLLIVVGLVFSSQMGIIKV